MILPEFVIVTGLGCGESVVPRPTLSCPLPVAPHALTCAEPWAAEPNEKMIISKPTVVGNGDANRDLVWFDPVLNIIVLNVCDLLSRYSE